MKSTSQDYFSCLTLKFQSEKKNKSLNKAKILGSPLTVNPIFAHVLQQNTDKIILAKSSLNQTLFLISQKIYWLSKIN